MSRLPSPARPKLRCAIYTRVSSDSGLEQEFNSLDNQREAAEAYVKSQAHEGWVLLPARYDDGGFSGGSMERPALQRLMADVRERRIDIIVVYKVDRLTRSLADFAKLVEAFDAHDVSFVSVTQAFNTTNSMGRLTLNVLLSFAQFEREVTGERIRDKIAASKRKGLWMGGTVPMGYRVDSRKLVVLPEEAEQVRAIHRRYLELRSVPALVQELDRQGFRTRLRPLTTGRILGGVALTHGPLSVILKNRMYLGELKHKGANYKGEHAAIVDTELFESVQATFSANRRGRQDTWQASGALLLGRIYDDRGNRMTPAHATKGNVRYRYYVSRARGQGRSGTPGSVERVPAPAIEAAVVQALREREAAMQAVDHIDHDSGDHADVAIIKRLLDRVVVGKHTLAMTLKAAGGDEFPTDLTEPWVRPRHARQRAVLGPSGEIASGQVLIRADARARLLAAIARARSWADDLIEGRVESTEAIAARDHVSERSVRMTIPLAFIAPKVVEAAVEGTLRHDMGVTRLAALPLHWSGPQSVF